MGPSFFTSIYIKHAQISRNSYEHFWWETFCIVLIYYVSCKLVTNLIMRVHSIFSFKFHWLKKAKGKLAMEITGLSRWFFVFFPTFEYVSVWLGAFLVAKNLAAMQEIQDMQIRSLSQEDLLEELIASHSSILSWKIPWTEEAGGLQSLHGGRKKPTGDITEPIHTGKVHASVCFTCSHLFCLVF